MEVEARCPEDIAELDRRIRVEKGAKQRERLRAVKMAIQGQEAKHIAAAVGHCRRSVQDWAYDYRDGGVDAIAAKPQPGAPTKLPRGREEEFQQRMLAGPAPADGVCTLRGKDAARILKDEFGASYTLAGAYRLLHRLGFSSLRPARRHRKNDPEKMREFLASAPLLSKRSPKRTRKRKSKSGSRTKPASVNKAG